MLTPLHNPKRGILRIAGLMSGSGTNLAKILETEWEIKDTEGFSPFEVVVIFTDCADSKAVKIGKSFNVPVVTHDIRAFYNSRNTPLRDLFLRQEYDALTVMMLKPYVARAAAYAGYMSIATAPLINAFMGINVHPADLSVEADGKRTYTGDHAVRDAIVAHETTVRSTTHLIEPEVDGGRLLMISPPMGIEIPKGASREKPGDMPIIEDHNQDRLKEAGDWLIFPKTIEDIARGRFAMDETGLIHYDGEPIPNGIRLEG